MSISQRFWKSSPAILALTAIGGVGGLAYGAIHPARQAPKPQTPQVKNALKSPETLWAFLTSPNTSYADRMAAAAKGKKIYPLSQVPRLLDAIESLREEELVHRWGFKRGRGQSVQAIAFSGEVARMKPGSRERKILGRTWTVPETPTMEFPAFDNGTAASKAPWPWQAKQALEALYNNLAPQMHVFNPPEDVAYAEKWYAEALKLPTRTDREATRFVRMTMTPAHYKSLPILAKWRRIALDPKTPEAASLVATNLGEAIHLWDDPRAPDLGEAVLADILRGAKNPTVLREAAWGTMHLKDQLHFSREPGKDSYVKIPTPWTLLVALGDAATHPKNGDEWSRFYYFGTPACYLLPDPPVKREINDFRPDSTEAKRAYQQFATWFKAHRAEMVAKGAAQTKAKKEIAIVRAG